jgi:ATP-dependent DNA helicase RecQ
MPSARPASPLAPLLDVIARHWGFDTLRPLQEPAIRAVLDGRDSLVVLPTGGGKSLCYQAPAVYRGDTTVVVSPLISLMKDQVDSLRSCGVPAIQLDSSQLPAERRAYERDVLQGAVRLLFVSPERLVGTDLFQLLQKAGVRTFAIDEAHCISHWGHDFRPEYRQLNRLKELFPEAAVHAYTATATEHVRQDIIAQLGLRDPEVLVGNFDRPNLTYRILARREPLRQVLEVIDRHANEAGIIYCLRRADVDELTAKLNAHGCKALAYHAGLPPEERHRVQEAFADEECDLVVATVAFGMGIDRSNLRFVLHQAMPKSIEHYQQETGRAGRDGLEAECVLLYSGADTLTWKAILEKSAAEPGTDPAFLPGALQHLNDIDRYCRGAACRHRALVEYFGQRYEADACGACDVCLGETQAVAEGLVIAQKILSCVARVKERFGIGHVTSVLRGENAEAVVRRGHDHLSTFGLLSAYSKPDLRDWIYQLIGQGVLLQEGSEYPVLRLNPASWEVMRGERPVRLVQIARRPKGRGRSAGAEVSWDGVERGLFEELRTLRRRLADERQVPPYIIFGDATLRELARVRPSDLEAMRMVYGIGEAKRAEFGERFLEAIDRYCLEHPQVNRDARLPTAAAAPRPAATTQRPNPQRDQAFGLFRQGASLQQVVSATGRSRATACDYLCDYIRQEKPARVEAWVREEVYERVVAAARQVGTQRLKPIYILLGEQVPYDDIRIVLAHLGT